MKLFEPKGCKPENLAWKSQILNSVTFDDYFYRLEELALNMFKWNNLPPSVDERFLELTLCEYGYALYFNDEIMGNMALTCMIGGPLDVYRIPIYRRAYAANGYQKTCSNLDSVIIYNNFLRQPSMMTVVLYARRLTEIERTIETNVAAQKTPKIILTEENQLLTWKNLQKKIDNNEQAIFATKGVNIDGYNVLDTSSPFVADKLNLLKRQIWNEALTFFGINNVSSDKKERLVSDEVETNLGAVEAQRNVMLNARRQAAEKINRMFGTNISVEFRDREEYEDGMLYDDAMRPSENEV